MPKIKDLNQQPDLPQLEEEILQWWQDTKAFEKSIEMRPADKAYVFYDGPPFATGLPHYGHLLASTTKDVIPRYWTMKGYRVERIWGWDCHGLPIENLVEKELNLKTKQAIETYGVDKFNEASKNTVLRYADDWKKIIPRIGRWVDMENDYKTMEPNYMESLWWVFKSLWERKLIYQSYKSMHVCPRCNTPLSNFEVTLGYKDITDQSVIVKFPLNKTQLLTDSTKPVFILAWTTTPWTLPGNALLAIDPKLDYVLFESQKLDQLYIVAKSRLNEIAPESKVVKKFKGKEIINLTYEPLFPYFKNTKNAFRIVAGDFINTKEGTGIVHIAPAFGEDDYQLGEKENIELIQHVTMGGIFVPEVTDFAGMDVKPKHNHDQADKEIIEYLQNKDFLFSQKTIEHSYPHCWRCDTPLLNYATESWFVKVTAIKDQLLANNQKINWIPDNIQNGRFGNWLENARDWAISRNRYWGTPLPVWQSEDGDTICIGSKQELENLSGQKVSDLHKHVVDEITFEKNGKTYTRIPEVLDCWFESGAMPYGSVHYPFENKAKFEANFPAEFISEGIDQTRGWFYTLHVLATALTTGENPAIKTLQSTSSFKNVIVNGVVLAQDGKKMSKRLQNYPDPMSIVNKYGVDSLRLYLMSSTVMKSENLSFNEKEVADIRRKVFIIWWNVFKFFKTFGNKSIDATQAPTEPDHVMDKWLLSKTQHLIQNTTQYMDNYDLIKASRILMEFVDELSTWYLRLSRDRLRAKDNQEASHVFGYTLYTLAQLMAPLAPFFPELIHHNLIDESTSIHHTNWPQTNLKLMHPTLESKMATAKEVVNQARFLRKDQGVKLRQPLTKLTVTAPGERPQDNLLKVIAKELNVKEVDWKSGEELKVKLNFTLTAELKAEGEARELMRDIQKLRKKAGLKLTAQVNAQVPSWPIDWQKEIEAKTNTLLSKGLELRIITS